MDNKFFPKDKDPQILRSCVRCGICLGSCPVYLRTRLETDSPRGRMELIRALIEGEIGRPEAEPIHVLSVSEDTEDQKGGAQQSLIKTTAGVTASHLDCLFCLQCQRDCAAGVPFDRFLFQGMAILRSMDRDAVENVAFARRKLNPTILSSLRIEGWIKDVSKRGKQSRGVTIFTGCFAEQEEMNRVGSMLSGKGIDAIVTPEGLCCGLPYLLQGDQEGGLLCMKRNLEIFKRLKIRQVLTPCPFCLETFKRYYPLILNQEKDMVFEHISDAILSSGLIPQKILSKKVTYHPPCLLESKTAFSHQQSIAQMAGDLYVAIPSQICCGHGFGYPSNGADIAEEISQDHLKIILEKGVQILITDCPSCTVQWKRAASRGDRDLEVIPFWQLFLEQDPV